MVTKIPVVCPHCREQIGYQEDFMYMYIAPPGYVCKHCGEVAIPSNKPMYRA